MRHRNAHRSSDASPSTASRSCATRPRRCCARAHRDDGAEGQGAAAVRRAADHHRQARRQAADPKGQTLLGAPPGDARPPQRGRRHEAVRQLAPRFMERPGGYTRILKLGHRRGDARGDRADRTGRQRVRPEEGGGREERGRSRPREPETAPKTPEEPSASACAPRRQRIRGGKKEQGDGGAKGKASKPARGAAKKTTTPRKAGGS